MTDTIIKMLNERFPMKEVANPDFCTMKLSGMNFVIKAYDAKGLGRVSVMKAKGFFGLMKMDTIMINPFEIDMPLLSYDRVLAMGNDTLIFELYDTFINKKSLHRIAKVKNVYSALAEHNVGSHWYDDIKLNESLAKKQKKAKEKFDALANDYISAYIEESKTAEKSDVIEKKKKSSVYVEGLLNNGGPATDIFLKSVGKEKTQELFRKILFGTV